MNRRNVSSVRDFCAKWIARAQPVAAAAAVPVKRVLAVAWRHVRYPTRRGVLLAVAAVPALFALYALALVPFTPGIGDIRKARVDQPAQVLSADGKLLAEFKPSNREWVPLKQISPHMVDALIATEDHRFYQHHGLDWKRTASAALHTFSGDRQGGSTITQQLARNLYPDEIGRAPTLTRKLKEAITALKIEAVYSKDEILETYLNTVPFLYNAYGVEMAARTYFDKSADELDVLDSATLVGMLKGNSYYNPVLNPERALQRRNTVLAQMVKYGKLSAAQFAQLQRRPLRIDFERQKEPPGPAPHFAQQLRKWLIAWADRNDYNIYSDGLVVRTTIDSRLQQMATQALTLHANQLQGIANAAWSGRDGCGTDNEVFRTFMRESPEYKAAQAAGKDDAAAMKQLEAGPWLHARLCKTKTDVQAGFVAVDPRDGQIRAWVGSRDFARGAVRPRRASAPSAGLDVQAVRLRRRVRERDEAGRYVRRPARRDSAEGRRDLAAERRRPAERQADDAARCARAVAQPDYRAGDGEGRPDGGRAARARHGRTRKPARARAVARARHEPGDVEGDGRVVRDDRQRRAVHRTADGHADRGSPGRRAGRIRARAARARARRGNRQGAARRDARRRDPRHRQQHPHALRRARRRGGQDGHDAGQRGRLVHPDAAEPRRRRVGRLRRRPRDAAQRLLGAGRPQRAADRRRFLPACAARAHRRYESEIRHRAVAGLVRIGARARDRLVRCVGHGRTEQGAGAGPRATCAACRGRRRRCVRRERRIGAGSRVRRHRRGMDSGVRRGRIGRRAVGCVATAAAIAAVAERAAAGDERKRYDRQRTAGRRVAGRTGCAVGACVAGRRQQRPMTGVPAGLHGAAAGRASTIGA
ncbi:Peptidoglycan glycosyltransferase [Burkholderia dolosa AU0158]|nr:Peptidoglycan glycosyltransferase [Burkholderia dolosa AU0158]